MVNFLNRRLCIYTSPFKGNSSYKELIDLASKYGNEKIEYFSMFEMRNPDIEAAKELRKYADSKGITVSCFSVESNIADDDAETDVERLKHFAECAEILGSPYLHHTIYSRLSERNMTADNFERRYERGIENVRRIYDTAAGFGVRTIFEDQGLIFNGVKNFGRFLRDVDRNVGVVADFGNTLCVDETADIFIDAYFDRVVHAHLKDVVYTPKTCPAPECLHIVTKGGNYFRSAAPGKGCVDLKGLVDKMESKGYKGYYALEYYRDTEDEYINDMATVAGLFGR